MRRLVGWGFTALLVLTTLAWLLLYVWADWMDRVP